MTQNKYITNFLFLLIFSCCLAGQAQTIKIGRTSFIPNSLEVGGGQPTIAVCDFNADGHQDVIVANYSDHDMIVYQGNGAGQLTEVGRFATGQNPTGMDVADVNGDGRDDVVVANHETSFITVLLGDGTGNFKQAPQSPLNIDVDPHPHAVRLTDLDGDNQLDLIVDNRSHNGLLILKGLKNGNFKTPGQVVDVGGDPYRGFATGDINGDGKLDLVTPNPRAIGIVSNNSTSKLRFSLQQLPTSESPFAVELAEMNGDVIPDVVVAYNGNSIHIIPGDGQGHFLEAKKTTIKATSGAKQIAVGDINGDGNKDALISSWSGEILAVLGNAESIQGIGFRHPDIPNPWGVALTDLNEDGKSDLIIADGDSKKAVVYLSENQ